MLRDSFSALLRRVYSRICISVFLCGSEYYGAETARPSAWFASMLSFPSYQPSIVHHSSYVLQTEAYVKSLSSIPIGARFRWNDSQSPVIEKQPWHGTHFFDDREKRRIANRVLKLHE